MKKSGIITKLASQQSLVKKVFNWGKFGSALSLGFLFIPVVAIAQPKPTPNSENIRRLSTMFSADIQQTLSACWEKGKVNLAAGASSNGTVVCGDGSENNNVKFNDYVDTLSDFFGASFLIGAKSALESNPQLSPEMLAGFLKTPDGINSLRNALEVSLVSSQMLPKDSPESVKILVNNIIQRSQPILEDPKGLTNLLGSKQQYQDIVQKFCYSPGMSVNQALTEVTGLNSIQLYAICVKESGIVDGMMQQKKPENNN